MIGFDTPTLAVKTSRFKKQPHAGDHWHRTERDPGRQYKFKDAETLIDDFFNEVESVLRERGIGMTVRQSGRYTETQMTSVKVQSLGSLRAHMKAIARGERPAPTDAARPSFNSVAALVRLLTPDNRQLLALIRDRKPQSVVELVKMTGRAQPNLTRTLAKLEAAGFITMRAVGRRKAPSAAIKRIMIEIDPYSDRDRLRVA